jgi:hypothetical protein
MSVPDPAVTDWVPLWSLAAAAELARVEQGGANTSITATAIASAQTVVTTGPLTIAANTVIEIEVYCPVMQSPAIANGYMQALLFEDATLIGVIGMIQSPAAAQTGAPLFARRRRTPAAGSHTYSLRGIVSGGSGGFIHATAFNYVPAYITVRTV